MHHPDDLKRQQVKVLSGYGVIQKHIANHIGIDETTLRRLYREELDTGAATAIAGAAKGLYDKVREGNLTAIIFYLKTRGGFREVKDEIDKLETAEKAKNFNEFYKDKALGG